MVDEQDDDVETIIGEEERTPVERVERVLNDIAAHNSSQETLVISSSQDIERLDLTTQDIEAISEAIEERPAKRVRFENVNFSYSGAEKAVNKILLNNNHTTDLSLPIYSALNDPSQARVWRFDQELHERVDLHNDVVETDNQAYLFFSQALKNNAVPNLTLPDDIVENKIKKDLVSPSKKLQVM